jgi:putative flippase GtrA/phospholipid N-methyltransferase
MRWLFSPATAMGTMELIVLIPAYRPGAVLVQLARDLLDRGASAIVAVDDGSPLDFTPVFDRLRTMEGVTVLQHAVNLGKGAALKTSLNFAFCQFPASTSFVTADADGQHSVKDILAIARKSAESPECLVLGTRSFAGSVPFRSRLGNRFTRVLVRWLIGQRIADTQTGLRAIPRSLVPRLLKIPANGYEFELDMLIAAKHSAVRSVEAPIQTIYLDENRSSHFNPVLDSMKIYFVLLRFTGVSLLTAVLDNGVFLLTYARTHEILASQITGRLLAIVFNYLAARKAVFLSSASLQTTFVKYAVLVCANTALSYAMINALSTWVGLTVPWAKITAETALFFGNFLLQREFVFTDRSASRGEKRATDWTEYYQRVPPSARLTRRYTERALLQTLARFSPAGTKTMIEIGGANSCFADSILRQMRPQQYRVVDTNEHGLALLRHRFPESSRVTAINTSVLELVPEDGPVDVVFSVGLVEHFSREDTAKAIRAHFSVVREGGLVILSFPTPTALYRLARRLCEAAGLWRFPDERPLDREEVLAIAREHGTVLLGKMLWPLVFTQYLIAVRVGRQASAESSIKHKAATTN